MEAVVIKPHHFMDIIKLYGSGLEVFVPDEKLGHDFYRVGNQVLSDPSLSLALTEEGDDICQPCRLYQGRCQDGLANIPGYTGKDAYNRRLDRRIFSLFGLSAGPYPALGLCGLLYASREKIFQVWKEEESLLTKRRYRLFTAGAERYIARWGQG